MLNRDPSFVPPAILPVTVRRGLDRRRGIAALTTAVTTGLALADPRAARERLEEELRGALQARSVRLRDDRAQPVAPPPDAVCFDVPSPPGDGRARLEVIFDKPRPLDDWTGQLIEAATQLSSVVLELERAMGRVRLGASATHATDGAAPLIGSSEAIRRVRERIERVAATDFTVLIEGEWNRQGTGRTAGARAQPPPARAVRRGQLRRDRRDAARGGAVWHRGAHRHRRARPARQVRARPWRHAVPRRGIRSVRRGTVEAAARHPGSLDRACRWHAVPPREHPYRRGDQPSIGGVGSRGTVSDATCTIG